MIPRFFQTHPSLTLFSVLLVWVMGLDASGRSLREAFADHFLVGTAVNEGQIVGRDERGIALLEQHFNSVTAENEMKWSHLQPEPGNFEFRLSDLLVEYAEERDFFLVGHTLLWHNQTPAWVFEGADGRVASRDLLIERLRTHIHAVVGRYEGRVKAWDVVNEVFEEDGSFRHSPWYEIIGPEFIELAFRFAQEADPEAELYYNDFNLYKSAKRNGAVRLVKDLQSKGVRIDGVGFQGHYGLLQPDFDDLEASIEAVAETGVQVMFTELDVTVLPFPDEEQMGADIRLNFELKAELNPYADGMSEALREELADRYESIFKLFLKHSDSISRVTLWGIDDGMSWRNNWPVWGRTDYPLLFDRDYQPKRAFLRVLELVE